MAMQRITPFLWFDHQAEPAAKFYTGIFPNSRIVQVARYGAAGQDVHGRAPGSVMTVEFELDGQRFTALNGGPLFKFNESISFVVHCATQKDVDYYWDKLGEGGDPDARQCGWLKDPFGVSWQVVPTEMIALLSEPGSPGSQRAFAAMMQMKKLDIEALRRAHAG
jgi:predicted 3-demethylubiquinone-9 3-methyltransferase (glyoxalase superfamily)